MRLHFPLEQPIRRRGFAYSRGADLLLAPGVIACLLGSVIMTLAALRAIVFGDRLFGFVIWPGVIVILLANAVVFLRMLDRRPR